MAIIWENLVVQTNLMLLDTSVTQVVLHVVLIVAAKIVTIPVVKNQLHHLKARERGVLTHYK